MINTIIVDDEKPARDELAYLLKSFPEINLIGQGKNGVEAVSMASVCSRSWLSAK